MAHLKTEKFFTIEKGEELAKPNKKHLKYYNNIWVVNQKEMDVIFIIILRF